MYFTALTLGLLGSLHCIGMCGPLALAFGRTGDKVSLYKSSTYHLGRTFTYGMLGLVFGGLGKWIWLSDLQQVLSLVMGAMFILYFLGRYSSRFRWKMNVATGLSLKFQQGVQKLFVKFSQYPPVVPGMINGLLPCGLVYVAIAGSMATFSPASGFFFMVVFGLGTIPALLMTVLGMNKVPASVRSKLTGLYPVVALLFGIFMIYRGLVVEMPVEIDFMNAIQHPIICH